MIFVNNIRKNNLLYKFNNELEYLNSEEFHFDWTSKRISLLENIINKYNNISINNAKEEKNNENKLLTDVLNCMYKKKWHKINNVGHSILIKNFLNKKIGKKRHDRKKKKKVMKKLFYLLENDDTFSDYIIYDDINGCINNISILKFNKNKNNYFISI
jgi:hypothetical protein